MKRVISGSMALGVALIVAVNRPTGHVTPLIVHEWGTITTHHAPDGTPQGRLNHIESTDTLPAFVHRYEPQATSSDPNLSLIKTALVAGRPDVTMRLETPVIYFYPPHGATIPPFDVGVAFRGGILNEFYPQATASVGPDAGRVATTSVSARLAGWNGRMLADNVVSHLLWRGVALGDSMPLMWTTSHVWLAPRQVHAAAVK